MLEQKVTEQSNAIEEYFCKPFEKALLTKRKPMDKDTTALLSRLLLSPPEMVTAKMVAEIRSRSHIYLIIENVLEICTVDIKDGRVKIFMDILSDGRPGWAIMYVTYVQYWAKKMGHRSIDLDLFCHIFPWGFLPEDAMTEVWDGQKLNEGGSLLDCWQCSQSIQF